MTEKAYQLRTLSRALDVLNLLETSPEPLTMTAIAERLGEANPVIFRVLKTLEAKGFIRKVGETKKYAPAPAHDRLEIARLTVRVLHHLSERPPQPAEQVAERLGVDLSAIELALNVLRAGQLAVVSAKGEWSLSPRLPEITRAQSTAELIAQVRPVMERLHEATGETVALFVPNGALQVALHVLTSRHPLRYTIDAGTVYPVNRGAAGKAHLAWLDDAAARALLNDPALAHETIDVEAVMAERCETLRRGWAQSFGERIAGAAAVSMPVMDLTGDIRCLLIITGPESRFPPETVRGYAQAMRAELTDAGLFRERSRNADSEPASKN